MKKELYFVLIAFVLVISGCEEEVIDEGGPFVGGEQGVSLSFVDGAPVSEFAAEDSVPVKLKLINEGEYDIPAESASVAFFGFAVADYDLSSEYKTVSGVLKGVEKDYFEDGGEAVVELGTLNYKGTVSNFFEPIIRAKVCYPYNTEARVTVCANSREITESDGEIVCEVEGEKIQSTKVSSSPIQITSLTEQIRGSEVSFRITLENKGLGEVYMDDSECSTLDDPLVKSEKKNKVHFAIMPEDIVCSFYDGSEGNEGYIRLDEGLKEFTCIMPVENTGASYEREVSAFLDFKYVQSTIKQLKIFEE